MPLANNVRDRLAELEQRFEELNAQLADPATSQDYELLGRISRERASLEHRVTLFREARAVAAALSEAQALLRGGDAELHELAGEEVARLEGEHERLLGELRLALVPRDPNDEKDVIVEVRAGTGGDEAGLFAADLYRMYQRYGETQGWKTEVLSTSEGGLGGFKEIVFEVRGVGAYQHLKYESGVHRVQRVPQTESQGRLHTSAATVAVLLQAKEVEVDINPSDLRIDLFHSGGAGGQNVNKVETGVRIIHLPTGIKVECQDERSQLKNKLRGMAILRARILDLERQRQQAEIAASRRAQVKTGDRSEKIRTYNFPQDRVTDHRIGVSFHNLPAILAGSLDPLVDALAAAAQTELGDASRAEAVEIAVERGFLRADRA